MKRPLFISFLLVVSGAFALLLPLMFGLDLLLDVSSYRIDGIPVSRAEFLDSAGLIALYIWVFSCVAAWAVWWRVAWSRYLILLMYVGPTLYALFSGRFTVESIVGFLGLVIGYWYFFRKPNVVEYFTMASNIPLEDDG